MTTVLKRRAGAATSAEQRRSTLAAARARYAALRLPAGLLPVSIEPAARRVVSLQPATAARPSSMVLLREW
jgi:hypothetical protein